MADKDVRPTCQNNNSVLVKDGTLNLAATPAPRLNTRNAFPGTVVAWNWEGHGRLTTAAIDQLSSKLPAEVIRTLRWVSAKSQTQNRDLTDIPTGGHWTPEGQKHHFMKYKDQEDKDAYDVAVEWIFTQATTAAQLLKNLLAPKRHHEEEHDWGFAEEDPTGPHLGNALHALQDSFSPGHVDRDSNLVIRRINIYDEENKHPKTPGKLAHAQYDESWKVADGNLSPLGQAAADASVALILYFLHTAYGHTPSADAQKRQLFEKYLRADFSSGGAPPGGDEKQVPSGKRWIG
jgi:hypothetical protein